MSTNTERAVFAVELKDETSGPSQNAARALLELRDRLEAGTKKLREMQVAMNRLKAGSNVSIEAVRGLKAAIDAQKASVSSMQARYLELGGNFEAATKPAASALDRLTEAAGSVNSPIAGVLQRMNALRALVVGSPIIAATLGVASALLAVGAAAVAVAALTAALTVQLVRYALASADARRTEMLRLQGLMTLRAYNRGAAGSARELVDAIDRVTASSSLGRDQVGGYAEQLYRAGFRGTELSAALEGVGTTASVQGDRYAARFLHMARVTRAAGGSVRELADTVRLRIGGIAQRQALGFDAQMTRLRENFGHLFDELDIEPALRGLHQITSLFSQQHAFGRSLALVFRVLFNPLLRGSEDAGRFMRRFLMGMMLTTLRLAIVVLRARNAFVRTFGSETTDQVEMLRIALWGGAAAAAVFAVSLLPAAAALAVVGAALLFPILQIYALMRAGIALGRWLDTTHPEWVKAGRDLVDGFTSGITSRLEAARAAVTTLGTSATEALRDALEIRSPSRVFARLGAQIPAGLSEGIESGADGSTRAAADMVRAPQVSARGSSGAGITIGELHVHASGDAQSLAEAVRDALVSTLRGIGTEDGVPT